MVSIRVSISNLNNVEDLARRISNPAPLYKAWADYTEGLAVTAFKTQTAPFGQPWQPLTPRYAEYKRTYSDRQNAKAKRNPGTRNRRGNPVNSGNSILRWSGQLYDSIYARVEGDGVRAGAGYQSGGYDIASIHQFGAPRRNIPSRQFFPLDSNGEPLPQYRAELQRMAIDWLNGR